MLTYGSLFTGIGGFDLGFDRAGMQPAWQIERDKDCNRVLGRHWPDVRRGNDVCAVKRSEFERVDVICGGFPCQDVSVAGNRKGLAGERSGLWHQFRRIVAEFKPRVVVVENVPGLYSSHGGRDYLTVIRGLAELGYCVGGALLDSQYFGVPQRRDRVFLVGSLGDGRCAEILFEPESVRGDSPPRRETGESVAGTVRGGTANGSNEPHDKIAVAGSVSSKWAKGTGGPAGDERYNLVAHTLRGEGFDASEDGTGRGTPLVAYNITPSNSNKDFNARESDRSQAITGNGNRVSARGGDVIAYRTSGNCGVMEQGDKTAALNCATDPNQNIIAIPIQEIGKRQSGTPMNGVGHGKNGDPMYTLQRAAEHGVAVAFAQNTRDEIRLQAGDGSIAGALGAQTGMKQQTYIQGGMMVRRLTPRECERLQGFPDDHTRWDAQGKEISDSARYRMLGNAVTVYPAEWIGKRIVASVSC